MKTCLSIFFLFLLALAPGACKNTEFADTSESEDIPEGGGLITGEDGEFVLYRK